MRAETRHSAVLVSGAGVTAVISMIYVVFAGRVLGPASYAEFVAAISFVHLSMIAFGPINATVARFTAQYASRGEYGKVLFLTRAVWRRISVYGLLGLAVGLVVFQPVRTVLRFESAWPLLVAYAMVYLHILLNVPRGVLRGAHRFGSYNINIVIESGTRLVFGVILLTLFCNASVGLSAYVAGLIVVLFVSRVQLRSIWHGHEAQRVDVAAVKRFTVPMSITMFTSAAFQNMDMLFVKHYFEASEAGVYGAATRLAGSIVVLVTPFSVLLLPMLTAMYEQGRGVAGTFLRLCGYFLLLAAGPIVLFWLWPERVMLLLYGEAYVESAPFLLPLAGALVMGSLSALISQAFVSRNSFRFLVVYLPGMAAQVACLCVWHDSLQTVVTVVLAAQGCTLVMMAAYLIFDTSRRRNSSGAVGGTGSST